MVAGGRELIDTLWNVNQNNKKAPVETSAELIDTLWNVNELYAVDSETRFVN